MNSLKHSEFQQVPKTTEVVEDHPYRGSDCGSGFDASPTTYMSVSALPVTVS
jgi:hypothetical protein